MAKNLLVINVDIRETRVALIENGIIAELHLERESSKGTLGNIDLGRVSRVLPGMQAAFIDVGMERAAFLHVEDLIRPNDFEAYLAGDYGELDKSDGGKEGRQSKGEDDSDPAAASGSEARTSAVSPGIGDDDDDDDEDDDEDDEDDLDEDDDASVLVAARGSDRAEGDAD